MVPKIDATIHEVAAAFAEWERRFREDFTRFLSDASRLKLSELEYGDRCAVYLADIIREQRAA